MPNIRTRISGALKLYAVLAAIGGAAMLSSLFFGIGLCPVFAVIGIPCPACGLTRAFMSLPDIGAAFFYHPLFWILPLLPLIALFPERTKNSLAIAAAGLILGVWVVRMFLFFPHTEPMVYNGDSLLAAILAML